MSPLPRPPLVALSTVTTAAWEVVVTVCVVGDPLASVVTSVRTAVKSTTVAVSDSAII
jgi:hypothetical protein